MTDTNGTLKRGETAMNDMSINGKTINGLGGSLMPLNVHTVILRNRPAAPRRGFFGWITGVIARCLIWYTIFTVLFRCPATLDVCTESTSGVCRPYFQFKHAVSPYLESYYFSHVAPYVDLARPSYNALDQKLITPGRALATKYGAPRVQQAKAYGKARWQKQVQPQLQRIQGRAWAKYDNEVAPYVMRLTAFTAPYFEVARKIALQTYHDLLLPSYELARPYGHTGYTTVSKFTRETAIPSALWVWNTTYMFLDRTVWPQLRLLYVENVEPQLVKIRQRLGRYHGKKTVAQKSVTEPPVRISSKMSSSYSFVSSVASACSSASTSSSTACSTAEVYETAPVADSHARPIVNEVVLDEKESWEEEDDVRRKARETVVADLKDWQERYSKAAEEGAAEIAKRVEEITKRAIRRNARTTGKSHLEKLRGTTKSEMAFLKKTIVNIVRSVIKGQRTQEEAQKEVAAAVRKAGLAIKQKAQDVREWHESYDAETKSAITEAARNHFKILDGISDLALQKIGMNWAWMDGVTYKDWAKYHELKGRFDEWQMHLEHRIVTHPGLQAAQAEGAAIEEDAMEEAAKAAKELARLKQVSGWKLAAGDLTDEFDSKAMKRAADVKQPESKADQDQRLLEEVPCEKIEEGIDEPDLSCNSRAAESKQQNDRKDVTVEEIKEVMEESELFGEPPALKEDSHLDLASMAVVFEAPVPAVTASDVKETTIATSSREDEAEPVKFPVEEARDIPDAPEAASSKKPSVKSAFLGVVAESVASRQPILDDDTVEKLDSYRKELSDSLASGAQSVYSAAMSVANQQYAQAFLLASGPIKDTPKPAHKQMLACFTAAYGDRQRASQRRDRRGAGQVHEDDQQNPSRSHRAPKLCKQV